MRKHKGFSEFFNFKNFFHLTQIISVWYMNEKTKELPACPVATTVSLIGSKWKILIIRNLMARPWRFNELKKDLDGISQKVLTDSLRSMEADGIITRTVYPEVPTRVEYALSDLGLTLKPIISSMAEWGDFYKEKISKEKER